VIGVPTPVSINATRRAITIFRGAQDRKGIAPASSWVKMSQPSGPCRRRHGPND
jgi:hypothetical protein